MSLGFFTVLGLPSGVLAQLDQQTLQVGAQQKDKYVNGIKPLQQDNEYIKNNEAKQYWKIVVHYESQLTNSSCSSTTMSMVLNSLRYDFPLNIEDSENITQNSLVAKVAFPNWKKQTANNGGGVGIRKLKEYTEEALEYYGVSDLNVSVLSIKSESAATINKVREILKRVEASKTDRLVFNFNQGFLFNEEAVGHFAPFGAYDESTDRVLIMDPDRTLYEPYWVPLKLMVQSMKNRGLLLLSETAL